MAGSRDAVFFHEIMGAATVERVVDRVEVQYQFPGPMLSEPFLSILQKFIANN